MTETSGVITLPYATNEYKFGSVGTPIPNTEMHVHSAQLYILYINLTK